MLALKNNTVPENYEIRVIDPETKLVVYTFETYKRAGLVLKVKSSMISRRCQSKLRIYSPKDDKEYSCRLMKKDG